MQCLADMIQDGFESAKEKSDETDLMLAMLAAEMEYQSCLAELAAGT